VVETVVVKKKLSLQRYK